MLYEHVDLVCSADNDQLQFINSTNQINISVTNFISHSNCSILTETGYALQPIGRKYHLCYDRYLHYGLFEVSTELHVIRSAAKCTCTWSDIGYHRRCFLPFIPDKCL